MLFLYKGYTIEYLGIPGQKPKEQIELVTFCDQFKMLKHSTSLMYAFSQVGVVMLSSVLRSQVAISVSIQIANAFLEMRKFLKDNAEIFLRMNDMEQKHLRLAFDTNKKFEQVFTAIGELKFFVTEKFFNVLQALLQVSFQIRSLG